MGVRTDLRPGEERLSADLTADAALAFIGRIRTPFRTRAECPKSGRESQAVAHVEIFEPFRPALHGVGLYSHLILLYWLHEARRDLVRLPPPHLDEPRGVFALRSPVRPNPIGLSVVEVVSADEHAGLVDIRHIDCLDGTPLLDIKPYHASTDSIANARRPLTRRSPTVP